MSKILLIMQQMIGRYLFMLLLSLSIMNPISNANPIQYETATFAGGCFWGLEHYFQQLPGVVQVRSGYTGGSLPNPSYEQVCTGKTGHAEAIEILFDPKQISYATLLKHFWRIHDPYSLNRQGNDIGTQYRSAVFYHSPEQKKTLEDSLSQLSKKTKKKIVTQIASATTFYAAEDYHQNYLVKNPGGYCHIDMGLLKIPVE